MSPRNTRTGVIFERVIIPALQGQADFYEFFARGQKTGKGTNPRALPDPFRPGGKHVLDILVREKPSGTKIGIAVKWQQSSGTAEEKIALEFIRLAKFVEGGHLDRGYIVIGGTGWTLMDYFLGPEFPKEFSSPGTSRVFVLGIDALLTKINTKSL